MSPCFGRPSVVVKRYRNLGRGPSSVGQAFQSSLDSHVPSVESFSAVDETASGSFSLIEDAPAQQSLLSAKPKFGCVRAAQGGNGFSEHNLPQHVGLPPPTFLLRGSGMTGHLFGGLAKPRHPAATRDPASTARNLQDSPGLSSSASLGERVSFRVPQVNIPSSAAGVFGGGPAFRALVTGFQIMGCSPSATFCREPSGTAAVCKPASGAVVKAAASQLFDI